jgi:LuxR family maltose regulon positive regulatory protein
MLHCELGAAQLWAGRFQAARRHLETATEAEASGSAADSPTRLEALARVALIELLQGRPGRAEAHALTALFEADRRGPARDARPGLASLVLGGVALERDDLAGARADLAEAASAPGAHSDPTMVVGLAMLRSALLLAEGDPDAALHALAEVGTPTHARTPSPWAQARVALCESSAYGATGDMRNAAAILAEYAAHDTACAVALAALQADDDDCAAALATLDAIPRERLQVPAIRVRALLVRAHTAVRLGDVAAAQHLAAQSLAAARADRLRRPFVEAGTWFARLLRGWSGPQHADERLTRGLAADVPDEPPGAPADRNAFETLSEREHDVLERAAQMMSTQEIADDLYLSVNTVKTHLKSINRKLRANRRGEAVRRARQLHLL